MAELDAERWPPTYDFEELQRQISAVAGTSAIEQSFYDPVVDDSWYQGDILHLDCDVPLIDAEGTPATMASDDGCWLLIGNTCDLTRDVASVPWSQLVPLVDLGPEGGLPQDQLAMLRSYSQTRRFYLPPWRAGTACGHYHAADFLRPVAIDRDALLHATRLGRLHYRSWVLLHSCLVRFLARGDGRND